MRIKKWLPVAGAILLVGWAFWRLAGPAPQAVAAAPTLAQSGPAYPSPGTAPAPDPVVPVPPSAPVAQDDPDSPSIARARDAWCEEIVPRLPGTPQQRCQEGRYVPGKGRSVQGRSLWYTDIPATSGTRPLRVLVLGAIHGDEMSASTLVFDWVRRAREHPAPGIVWRMAPLVNPDGLLHSPPTRVNAHGVDLNRNFPTEDWVAKAAHYWEKTTRKDPRRFPGPSAASEPETSWVLDQIGEFRPDLVVSVHAPYGLLDFDGPQKPPSKLGSLFLDQLGVYPGSLGNYGGLVRGVPVVTIELKHESRIAEAESGAMWGDLLRWIDTRLKREPAAAPAAATQAAAVN
ncbi:M14 family zinc carboxypeptidase [Amphibiibacter pelophylacis]|uniref:M14 family zinc carboxypeptidase n=1 Tax=Amphibiibacter pelophylacis TaxID=1799477 RepID=A0ACC6NXZ5_9BURK